MSLRNYSIGFERIGIDVDKVRSNATTCPKCSHRRKKRHDRCLSVNLSTGHYTCNHCDFKGRVDCNEWIRKQESNFYNPNKSEEIQMTDFDRQAIAQYIKAQPKPFTETPINDNGLAYLKSRGISEQAAMKAKLAQKGDAIVFNYYYQGKIINAKYRSTREKKMWQHQNAPKRMLWGIDNVIGDNTDSVIICEGEIDVLSFYEIGEYTALSVSQGAPNAGGLVGQKLKCLENCAEILEGKKEIIVAVDNDANGLYLEKVLCDRFGKDKCRVVRYPDGCKDANDVLVQHGAEGLRKCLNDAERVPIEGVTRLKSVRERMMEIKRNGVRKGYDIGIKALSDHYSFYKGWWNLFTGIPNSGKSEYVLYLMLCMSYKYGWKWAVFSPEHWPAEDFYMDVIEKFTGNRTDYIDDADFKLAMDFVEQHFFFVYYEADDGENSEDMVNSTKNVVQSIKRLVLSEGVDGFLIDPFNQLTKGSDEPTNERMDQHLERVLGLIDRLCKTHNLCGNIVAHPRTMYKESGEEDYRCPTAYQIAGGAMWYNKAYTITAVHRIFNQSDKTNKAMLIDIQKIKSHKRAGKPAPVNMKFEHGWYVGENEERSDAALYGAFAAYRSKRINGTQSVLIDDEYYDVPF